jgi:hypothetical protein
LVNSLIVLQTTPIYCKLMRIVTDSHLICELDLGACNCHVRTLQNMERERTEEHGKGLHIPTVENKEIRILHGVDR